jgi:hypothetical protein
MVIRPDPAKPPLVCRRPGAHRIDQITHASRSGARLSLLGCAGVHEQSCVRRYGFIAVAVPQRGPARTVATWAISGLDGTPFATLQDGKYFKEGVRLTVSVILLLRLVAHTFM